MRTGSHRSRLAVQTPLHELENQIMNVVWSRRWEWFSVADVLRVLEQRRSIAYTTVMTTVARLHAKGLLDRRRDGKRYLYKARLGRAQWLQALARRLIDGLDQTSPAHAMALLAERVREADHAELDELERLIALRRRELGR
ncbi:MAG: BlaI/MecI/CopY family transcriptional regulator [Myxococcota bacterium]|nr:BlaI/MecI/CopY family transcriptional regulator [Myxococcota bacterium]MDW8363136.1 BlaI/MecI/CopY family transcriptional regulator [Myxococcales bacterium]